MQEALLEEDSSTMSEQKIDVTMLARVDSDQKATASRVDNIENSLHKLEREVSEIKGLLKSSETPVWVKHYVYPCCVLISAAMVTAVIVLMVQMHGVQSFLSGNAGFIAGLRLEQMNPASSKTSEIKQILSQSEKQKIKIPADVIEKMGKEFIAAAKDDPSAWESALALVNYRSFLNESDAPHPVPPGIAPPQLDWYTTVEGWSRKRTSGYKVFAVYEPLVPNDRAMRFEPIDSKDNATKPVGPSLMVVDGEYQNKFRLDGYWLKHVVIRNAAIQYRGGPVILEDVYFVNCTFEIDRTLPSQLLADSVLEKTPTSFKHS